METKLNREASKLTVEIEGRLDTLTAPDLEKELEPALDGVTELVLDLKDLEYISSAGLRTLLAAQQYMEDNNYPDVKVLNINDNIRETFELTGFDEMLDIE